MNTATVRADLVARATAATAKWPQYQGYFEFVALGRVKKTIKTKMGLAFDKDEISLVFTADDIDLITPGFTTVWSFKNNVATSVPSHEVELL